MMTTPGQRGFKHWRAVLILLGCVLIAAGAYHDIFAKNDETYEGLKLFTDVLDLVEKNYVDEVDSKKLIESAIQGMLQGLDPHSALLEPDNFEDLQIDTKGKFTGIGIHITLQDGFVTVISPIEGTPAYKAGIQSRDVIIKVDDAPVRDLREAVKMMRGPEGTEVKVTIIRKGEKDPIDFQLVRDVIPIKSVKSAMLKSGFGYIRVTNFTAHTVKDLIAALEDLEDENHQLKGLVLDFRDNGGGLLNQAIEVSDIFLDKGLIVTTRGRQAQDNKVYKAGKNGVERNYPIAILINGGSASASEIVAGALQDHKRAIILGTTSFGKGSVQTVEHLRNRYGLKLTIARYYTPNDRSIQAKGIEPDIVVNQRFLEIKTEDSHSDRMLKEKDLKNHLEALKIGEKPLDETVTNQDKQQFDIRFGPLDEEKLRKDNQILRALDILTGYDILKHNSK